MKTSQKGDYCELLVLTKLIREDATTALPYGNQTGWDLLVEAETGWQKWQVKTAYRRKGRGSLYVDCIRSGDPKSIVRSRAYLAGDFDYLIAVNPETGDMWKIPVKDVIGRRCITLPNNKYQW